jgi:hypothetical protein
MGDFDSYQADYQACPASATTVCKGLGKGCAQDILGHLVITPLTTGAGDVSIQDGDGTAIKVFTGGGTLSDLKPHYVPINARSRTGAWSVICGANVQVLARGRFQ